MKDFPSWKEYEGASEGSGRSEKIWLINEKTAQTGLFKFKKDVETTDHVSECIACELAGMIGIPCAKFELGIYHGREGSMSYNIVDRKGKELREGIEYIAAKYRRYDQERLIVSGTGEKYSLEMIEESLTPFEGMFEEFLRIPVFDFLIGNTDRHQSNWALLKEQGHVCLSPLYDNGSSLCAYINNRKALEYLGKDELRWNSLVDTRSKSLIRIHNVDEKSPTHWMVLRYLYENYYEETKDIVDVILNCVNEESISEILVHYEDVISDEKQRLIKKFLMSKIDLLRTIYKKRTE